MAFIGNTNTTQAFTPAIDYFSGNGSTTAFTLSRPVASVAQVQVTIDNVAQNPSSAYTVSGSTITFTSAPLSGTNNIYVYYTSPITQVIAPGQGTVDATSLASSTGTGAVVLATSPTITTPTISSISSASATALTLKSAGTTAVTIDTSQNVGIGTTSPDAKFKVVASGANLLIGYSGTQNYFDASENIFRNFAGAERMRIDSSGNLLVGQTSNFSQGNPILVAGSSSSNQPIGHRGYGGVDGNYVDWLISAPYQGNTTEQNRIKSSISSGASSSGLQFWISDGAGASTQTQSFRINRTSCTVIGSLSKGSGSFKIDHPLTAKKDTHHLVHSFIEGPQADLIYRGKVNLVAGTATVNIDTASGMTEGTFVALCRDVQCFTTNESDWTPVRGSVAGNILTIEAQDQTSTANISWMVIGERQDKHMYDTDWTDENGKVIVEPLKEALENR